MRLPSKYRFAHMRSDVSRPSAAAIARSFCGRDGGFALLFALVLVGFVATILVGVGLLTRVETRLSTSRLSVGQGRQNALISLDLALAHLQRAAGPDRRITARAELSTTGTTLQPFLTGVWVPQATGPVLTTWLVSGNHGSAPLAVTPSTVPAPSTPAGENEVFLVDRGTVSNNAHRVKLRTELLRVPPAAVRGFDGNSSQEVVVGHFAYWIGDQGIKASVAFPDSTPELDYNNAAPSGEIVGASAPGDDWSLNRDKRDRLPQMRLSRPRTELMFAGFDPDSDLGGLQSPRARLARMLTYAQLPMIAPALSPGQGRTQFHHASTLSRGVLLDLSPPQAKLREDLSDTPDIDDPALHRFLGQRPFATAGTNARFSVSPFEAAEAGPGTLVACSVGPVLTECLFRFALFRDAATSTLFLRREVQAEFWNPYTSDLALGTSELVLVCSRLPTVEVQYGDTRFSVDLNAQLGALPVDASTAWSSGEIRVLRGGTVLEAAGSSVAKPVVPAISLPADRLVDRIVVTTPSIETVDGPAFEVRVDGRPLALYEPGREWESSTVENVPAENDSTMAFGYGFAFRDDLLDWTDGTRAASRDPRLPRLSGNAFEPPSSSWSARPSENTGEIAVAGSTVFNRARRYAVFELPRQEVTSLGIFQHLIGPRPNGIGNAWGGEANRLFDRFFLSTIPRWSDFDPARPVALPNPYVTLHLPGFFPPALGARDGSTGLPDSEYLRDRHYAASHLLVRGAFNLNSTSIAAWQVVLGGMRVADWRYATGLSALLEHAYFRFSHSAQAFSADPALAPSTADYYGRGVRELTRAQIARMAQSIVGSLRTRGVPFPSISSFVDAGVIAQAISDAGINADLPAAVARCPGWLTQADILTAISPFLVPRSDTFVIRAYGDSQNPVTGEIEGRAWCEAMVQRVPELTSPAPGQASVPEDILGFSPDKYPFGRKFVVVSFRWLGPADI